MSRLYWHTKERTAELHGSEYHHLRSVAYGPAEAAWGLNRPGGFDRASEIMTLVAPGSDDHGLRKAWEEAQAANRRQDYEPARRFVGWLETALRVGSLDLDVAGVRLRTGNLEANTALVAGSDVIRIAAKVGYWAGDHCWAEGPDRKWLADIIDEGLRTGIYRRGLWYVDRPCDGQPADQPDRTWSDQGWDEVLTLLRESDSGPVILSYSVDERFPNRTVADWTPPALPDDWMPASWADSAEGRAEWAAMPDEDKAEYRNDRADETWSELPEAERWELAVAGLRRRKPWARLGPDTLTEYTFHYPVTVYDLFAPDRDDRVRRAVEASDVGEA